jgi:hypothetical protein
VNKKKFFLYNGPNEKGAQKKMKSCKGACSSKIAQPKKTL